MNSQQHWQSLAANQQHFHANTNGTRITRYPADGASVPRTQTPPDNSLPLMPEAINDMDEDQDRAHFHNLFHKADGRLANIFAHDGSYASDAIQSLRRPAPRGGPLPPPTTDHSPIEERPPKRVKRDIDEDDYGDDDEDDEDDGADGEASTSCPLKTRSFRTANPLLSPSKSGSSPVYSGNSPGKWPDKTKDDASQGSHASQAQANTSEDARKQLEQARKATEQAAKRSFHTMFYTLENDRIAMLEQQQLEDSEKQIQAEMDKNTASSSGGGGAPDGAHGSLSNANLGASSLTLKHLIARIDMKRDMVSASDAELRSLMNEVRKNRSKWASEENVNQEDLYEALDKVLTELKAHTEFSTPFLQRVNKRDAPDYYNLINKPMDLGSMTKKLKSLTYKSKADFVQDLNLIWDNCLRYNQDVAHPLRRMANGMRREAEKLIPLIPDLAIRPRHEVEAEERRKQNGGDDDAADDSDDEPIMSSRGRIAGGAKGTKSRTAPADEKEGTPVDQRPVLQLNGLLAKANGEGSEGDGSNGLATPPVGSVTPLNGPVGTSSNVDIDMMDAPSLNDISALAPHQVQEPVYEDDEYKIYKQITKKDRAHITKQRYQLFHGRRLRVEKPALLRTKAGMRRFLQSQQQAEAIGGTGPTYGDASVPGATDSKAPETLAEGMEDDSARVIPDYYEPQSLIPDIPQKLQWHVDNEGQVINQHEEYLRTVPEGYFTQPKSRLTEQFDANLSQLQKTRKVCSKIAVIKQMQIQAQTYTNQFSKYNPEPFVERDIEPHVTCGDDIIMAPEVCKAAMQRSVAKIFYHAGFEEMQPSAMDAMTDIAGDYFMKVVQTFKEYNEAEGMDATPVSAKRGARAQPRYTEEEVILNTLHESGYDIEQLDSYVKDDVDRLGSKLAQIHDRMKAHLSDLLRPALQDTGADGGASSFDDGSDQFVGGDFAEELGEDFFGFKELGLSGELGGMMSVPLHLLQSRVRSQYQSQVQTVDQPEVTLFEDLPAIEPVTKTNIQDEIGLVKNFFLAKLHANGDEPLVEDRDLPVKQQRPRPRLAATGKIVAAPKRPPKEQNAINKKKKKMEAAKAAAAAAAAAEGKAKGADGTPEKPGTKRGQKAASASILPMPIDSQRRASVQSQGDNSLTDKDDTGMISPQSIER